MTPYYEQDGITIFHADCRNVLPLLDLPAIHSVITDPPYGTNFSGKAAVQRTGGRWTKKLPGGYSFTDDPQYVRSVVVPIIVALCTEIRSVVVTPGVRNAWLYPQPDDLGTWFTPSGNGMSSWGFVCSHPILYYGRDPYLAARLGGRPNSTGYHWPNDANTSGHPCAKPISFMKWLVNRASLPGEMVLDPFMGSGTTLRSAKDLGRKAIGIEIEERYCEIAVKRLQQQVLPLVIT